MMFSVPKTEYTPSLLLDLVSSKIKELEKPDPAVDQSELGMIELKLDSPVTQSLSSLTPDAIRHGIREYYDFEASKRFITSPVNLHQILGEFSSKDFQTVITPKYLGVVRAQNVDMAYLYEIPLNSASIASINFESTASDPNSLLAQVEEIMQELKAANKELPSEVFDNWKDHWAYDVNGQLVLINPFRDNYLQND